MDFKIGDLVRLKSGGPAMTVEQTGERAMTGELAVWCVWFEQLGHKREPRRETFSPATLEIANDASFGSVRLSKA